MTHSPGVEGARKRYKKFVWWPRDRFGEIMPSAWLRHVTPWSLLNWLNDRYRLCWTNMVMWKVYGGDQAWNLNRGCVLNDYCGKFDAENCADGERDAALREISDNEVMLYFPESPE